MFSVDTNHSGMIDLDEFCTAIKGNRMMELSLGSLLEKMGVKFADNETRFAKFKQTERRRRIMKKEWEQKIKTLTKEIVNKLAAISKTDVPKRDSKDEELYKNLEDCFNAFVTPSSLLQNLRS